MIATAVIGGQFGSEGKGLIVGYIAQQFDAHVRVGSANAGHTVYTGPYSQDLIGPGTPEPEYWEKHVMRQLPCAAYSNPDAELYIGPGALISPQVLQREMAELARWRSSRGLEMIPIYVDARAHIITNEHMSREGASDLAERIGSTSATAGEGVGAAQAARVMRETSCVVAEEFYQDDPWIVISDIPASLAFCDNVLLEGTQGVGLSLTTGRFPYVTSRNTTVAGLLADAGVAPAHLERTIMVCRVFPIRVAGQSGPFWYDSREIAWGDIGIDPERERTSVTKKIRRVATFSMAQLMEAVILNRPDEIALTFCDYLEPDMASLSKSATWDELAQFDNLSGLVAEIQRISAVPVKMLGTGPHSIIDIKGEF